MKRLLLLFPILLAFAHVRSQFCVADYQVTADSTSIPVEFLVGLHGRTCFLAPCGPLPVAEIIVRLDSDSLPNRIELTGFQGDVSVTVMDTNCSFKVYDTCFFDVGVFDTLTVETYTGYHCLLSITIHMQQQLTPPRISATSLSTAPAGNIELCPVGVADPSQPRPRQQGKGYADVLGRIYDSPPCGIRVWDRVTGVLTFQECPK